jgi:hyaluronan synthase
MRNQSEMQKGRWAGLENLWSTTAVVVWMGFVAAAIARFVSFRLAPMFTTELMLLSSAVVLITLFYVLLK